MAWWSISKGRKLEMEGKLTVVCRERAQLSALSDLRGTAPFDLVPIRVFNVCAVHHNLLALS